VKARELRPGMVLRLAGELPVLIVEPGTVMTTGKGVQVEVPVLPLDPQLEVAVFAEGEVPPEKLPEVQVRLT
jgi:hypothetical protein